ncbi:MAG: MoxR family ATPase [Chloroflexi bacterium]|nr:MoxR family ATPase [Chloroflexota bacterium]
MTIPVAEVAERSEQVIHEVERAVVGKRDVLEKIMTAILTSGGHVLLEDFPGLAKTLIANSFATALGLEFKRIQFTPDLLPGDITGGYIFDRAAGTFVLRQGPIFANIILADEINRASPRTQSALLEAMQEYQVTLEGDTMTLPQPFIVLATQNPIEYEGTFPLPEAQLDRFIMKISVGYPTPEEEQEILRRRRERRSDAMTLKAVTSVDGLMEMREAVEEVYIDPDLEAYIVNIITETRRHRKVTVGASPRGTLALLKLSRAWAAIHGRDFVIPDDVKTFIGPALSHRLILEPDLWTDRTAVDDVLADITRVVPVPVLRGA